MEENTSQIDIETLINERLDRHNRLMKDLDGVMEVLLSFCEQAEWMMAHDYRIGELIGEVIVASTEVEHILPRTERYYNEYQRMLLPAIDRHKPKDFDRAMRNVKGIIPRLKPYCDMVKDDELGLKESRKGEVELTGTMNDKYIAFYEIAIENFTAAVTKMERHIVESHKKQSSISDEIIKVQFDTLYRQYCEAKQDEMKEYCDDIDNISSARSEIIAVHQASGLLSYYHQHKKRPELLIKAMRSDNKKEKNLLSIFDIKSRMDVLQEFKHYSPKEGEYQTEAEQPENLVFKKNHNGRSLDFFTIRKYVEVKLVNDIKHKYEWYAAYRIFDDFKLLDDLKLSNFAKQMNKWFPDAKLACDEDALGDYATGHTSKNFTLWNETTFINEKKNNQSRVGFRKLFNICHELKDSLKTIPTLNPRLE